MAASTVTDNAAPSWDGRRKPPRDRRRKAKPVDKAGDGKASKVRGVRSPKARLLTRDHLDGRTRACMKFDEIVASFTADLGGPDQITTAERELIFAFAGAAVHMHNHTALLLLGEKMDLSQTAHAIGSMCRIIARLGTKRRARDVTGLSDYLREIAKQDEDDIAQEAADDAAATADEVQTIEGEAAE